jgi:outer membrane murein-binding lipoprotein Lpp
MKPAIGAVVLAGIALAGEPDLRGAKRRFMFVSTRAIANFRAVDSIEQRLRDRGLVLHPQLIALRLRIEAALDETDAALKASDLAGAGEAMARAEALLDRYAQSIGGA